MPIYTYEHTDEWQPPEYEADKWECEPVFDVFQHMSEEHLAECPECGLKVRRVITVPNFAMKGGSESPDASTRRLLNIKRDEQTHINPYTQETVRLSGSKENRKDQIRKSYDNEQVPSKVREAVKDRNKCTFPNL